MNRSELGKLGAAVTAKEHRRRREDRWEEIERLLSYGESPAAIAKTLGVSEAAISRQAYRQKNYKLGRLFDTKRSRRYAKNGSRSNSA